MIAFIRKNITCLILKSNSNNVCKSPLYLSLHVNNLSTSSESESQACVDQKISNILVHKHNFAPEFALRIASKLTRVRNPENACLVLSFLRESGFSDARLEKMVRYNKHRFLTASLEDSIKPKIKVFEEMGISSNGISKIFSDHPSILQLSLNDNIIPSLSLLKRLLGSDVEVARVVRLAPRIIPTNLLNTVLPNVEFLKSCGVPMDRIRIVLTSLPNSFLVKPEIVRNSAKKAKEMGLNASSKNFIYAVSTIATMSNKTLELKMQSFRSLGFSDSDIMTMLRKAPQIFAGSMEKIKKITELLLDTRKYTISNIVNYPWALQSSIEKRFMPRLQIIGILESRNLIENWPALSTLGKMTNDKFYEKFVRPYQLKVSEFCQGQKQMKPLSINLNLPR